MQLQVRVGYKYGMHYIIYYINYRVMSEKESIQDRLDRINPPNMQAMEKIGQLNMVLAEIIPQNKELMAVKDRQKMELDAQNATLEEQRTHIAMLEKALSNAQERLSKREKICEELSVAAERANHLQRILHDTLLDKQTQDEAHAQERTQWEIDITQLKMQLNKDSSQSGSLKRLIGGRLSVDASDETVSGLRRIVHSKDERIMQLEKTILDLQRKLHDETERKKCALDALSEDLESKIKRLEDEKLEKDHRIAVLTGEREKVGHLLDVGKEQEGESVLGMQKMEEIRQKIQERKRKGRMAATGGLMGIDVDHSRSSSGSLLQPNTHTRTTSGPFDPNFLDLTSLLSEYSSPLSCTSRSPYQSIFKSEKKDDCNGENVWNV